MATNQEEKDKEMERRTAIVGKTPERSNYENEKAKWDSKGQLIDPEEIAKEKRERDVLLGKVIPTIEDYHDKEYGERVIGTVTTNDSIMADAVSDAEKLAAHPDAQINPDTTTVPASDPVSLAGIIPPVPEIPKLDIVIEDGKAVETINNPAPETDADPRSRKR